MRRAPKKSGASSRTAVRPKTLRAERKAYHAPWVAEAAALLNDRSPKPQGQVSENDPEAQKRTAEPGSTPARGPNGPPSVSRDRRANATAHGPFTIPVGSRTAWVDPATLDEHHLARKHFDLGDDADNAELLESVRGRLYVRLLVTGERCASGPNVTLDGRRRRQAGLRAGLQVEVEYLDDLDDAAELQIIVHSNIAASLARRLTERRKAELEQALRYAYGRRQGERTDLAAAGSDPTRPGTTSAASGGSERGETRDLIAGHMRESRHAVDDRETVYCRVVSPEALKLAVDNGDIKRSPAAALVHDIERKSEVAAVLEDARRNKTPDDILAGHPVIIEAKGKVMAALNERLHRKPPKLHAPKPPVVKEASAPIIEGFASIANFLGHRVVAQIDAGKVVLVDRGLADSDPNVYDPQSPTTRLSWVHDVRAAVDLLPTELRVQVTVGEVEVLEPVHCQTCGGTRFYRAGGCVRCSPMTTIGQIRQRIEDEERQKVEPSFREVERAARALRDVRCSTGSPDGRRLAENERKETVEAARAAMYDEIGKAVAARKPEIDAEFRAAAEVDRRLLVTHGGSIHDLHHPRQRIVISTRMGERHVVLWERVEDAFGRHCEGEGGPGVRVGDMIVPIVVNAHRGPWNHHRAAMRAAVQRAVKELFDAARGDQEHRDPRAHRTDLLALLSRRAEQTAPEQAPHDGQPSVEKPFGALVFEPPATGR